MSGTPGQPGRGPSFNAQGATSRRSFLPAFADARNRLLDAEIRELEAQLEQTGLAVEENTEHVKVLTEHLGNVRQEITYTQSRATAKAKEVETEEHLRELSQREAGRLVADVARQHGARQELEERVLGMQREVVAATERLDQFRLAMNFNQEELEQWAAVAKQKEDDNLAMEKYMRQDEARVKELNMQLERLAREVQQKKQDLDDEVTATQAAQTELNKAAEDFRALHAERQELLAQWESVLEAIAKRDAAILEAGNAFAAKKAALAQLKAQLDAQAAVLDGEAGAGAALEKQAAERERGIKRLYDTYTDQQAAAAKAQDQLDILSNTAQQAVEEVAAQQAANGHARAEVEKRSAAVAAAQQRYEEARSRLAMEGQQLGSMQQKIQELEALRLKDEARAAALEKELAALAKQQFAAGQVLFGAREAGVQLAGEISGARAQGRNLAAAAARLEEQVVRQQEVLYNVDFQLVALQRRVARAAGERTQDETEALNARIAALNQALEAVSAEHSMLVQQVKRAEDDYARAQRQNQASSKERASVLDDMSRMAVETESITRAVKAAVKQKEERLVEADVWRLETRRLRSLLTSKADQVMSLEHRKRALELGMAERRQEISVQMELMQGEARLLRDEVHRLTLELRERQLALEKLKAKYETLAAKSRAPDGGELQSQAYYIVKAAQERQELQGEAEDLERRITQTERECRALQVHLGSLAGTNADMNQHFRFSCSEQAAEDQAALKAALDGAFAALKVARSEERSRAADVEEARARLGNLQAEEGHMRRLLEDLEKQKAEAEQQLRDQEEKTARAAQRAERLKRQLPAKGPSLALPAGVQPDTLEADVQLAQVRDATRAMLDQLKSIAAEHPEAGIAQQVETELGVKLSGASGGDAGGSRPGTSRSSPAHSARGSPAASLRGGSARPGSSSSVRSGTSTRSTGLSVRTMQLGL